MSKMRLILTMAVVAFAGSAQAGFFSSEPPKDFLSMPVAIQIPGQSGAQSWPFTVAEFLEFWKKAEGEVTWVKSGQTWVLKVKVADPASGTAPEDSYVFTSIDKQAAITRFVQNGKDIRPALVSTTLQPLMMTAAQVLGKDDESNKRKPGSGKKKKLSSEE